MRKCLYFVVAFIVVTLFTRASQEAKAEEKAAGTRTLKVKLHYTGAGRVDDQHKIFVVLFDSPEFTKGEGAPPFAMKSATAKDKTVTFQISPFLRFTRPHPTTRLDIMMGGPDHRRRVPL
jgi:hypothetical protein